MLHKGLFLQIPRRKCAFYIATFVLRNVWTSRHNSRQDCNLDKLNNQSERIHGLDSHKEVWVMRKLARIATGVFQVQDSHVWAKSVTVPK
jgi:hypothetical protein